MIYLQHPDVDQSRVDQSRQIFSSIHPGTGALRTPDSEKDKASGLGGRWSDFSPGSLVLSPFSARGDDLDHDEAYFLEDEDDDDEDIDDDYDDDDDEDDEDEQSTADSDEDDDDEVL